MNVCQYLDAARDRLDPASDYELARELEIEPSAISNYRHGRSRPDNDMLIGLAQILDIDPLKLIALVNTERAKKERERAFWKNLLSTLSVIFLGITLTFSDLQAEHDFSTICQVIHYAQYAALAWFLAATFRSVNNPTRNHAKRSVPAALA